MPNIRKIVKCPKAENCPKFCTHKIPHPEGGACYPSRSMADSGYADPNCPDCEEVK